MNRQYFKIDHYNTTWRNGGPTNLTLLDLDRNGMDSSQRLLPPEDSLSSVLIAATREFPPNFGYTKVGHHSRTRAARVLGLCDIFTIIWKSPFLKIESDPSRWALIDPFNYQF